MASSVPDVGSSELLPREELGGSASTVQSRSSVNQQSGEELKQNDGEGENVASKMRNPCFCCCCACCNLRANCMAIGFLQIVLALLNATFTTEVPDFCKTAYCRNENSLINAELIFVTLGWLTCLSAGLFLLLAVFTRSARCALVAGILTLLTALFGLLHIIMHISLTFYINGRLADLDETTGDEIVASILILLFIIFIHSGLNLWIASCCFAFRAQIAARIDRRAHVPPAIYGVEPAHPRYVEDEAPAFNEVPSKTA